MRNPESAFINCCQCCDLDLAPCACIATANAQMENDQDDPNPLVQEIDICPAGTDSGCCLCCQWNQAADPCKGHSKAEDRCQVGKPVG